MTLEKHTKFTYWYIPHFDGTRTYFRTEEGAKRFFLAEDEEKPNGITFYTEDYCKHKEYTYEEVKAMDWETIRKKNIYRKINNYNNYTCISYPACAIKPVDFEIDFED